MRLTNVFSGRPLYYDRNPLIADVFFQGPLTAPAGVTQRWTYTVPSGRKAMIESIFASVERDTVATTAATVQNFVSRFSNAFAWVFQRFVDNTLNALRTAVNGNAGVLLAADHINGNTSDSSTGGTMDFEQHVKLLEFDA